ncbi:MAG: protein kinase domain-containing protein [Phycisphaerales bacterium]
MNDDASRYERIKRLFTRAIELPHEQWSDFLDRHCADDPALRREVEALLAQHDPAHAPSAGDATDPGGDDEPTIALAGQDDPRSPGETGGGGGEGWPSDISLGWGRGPSKPAAGSSGHTGGSTATPTQIGGYRIVRELDRGGMGTVYLGVKAEGQFKRRAAIKVVRRGMDTDEVLRRFEMERQVLSALNHPNIARLYDGGSTEQGLPYFAMEYIDGLRIDTYCDRNALSIDQRIELFIRVCDAVQYAHRNMVVHRDIKPANILVTSDGSPKLLDFGIAKLLNPELSLFAGDPTAPELRVMTPEYASPEQVRGEQISAASDVYSLGVLLYELLTGHRPYQIRHRLHAELIRVICEQEPDRPSTAVSRIDEGEPDPGTPNAPGSGSGTGTTITPETVSRTRGTRPDSLRRRLSGDIDNIVMMSLRKEPQRRYPSVEALARDLEAHRRGFPVSARPSSFGYRASKYIKRNKAGVALGATAILALGAGVYGAINAASVQAARARADAAQSDALAQEARADAEGARAEALLNRTRHIIDVLLFDIHDAIQRLENATEARKIIIETALANLESLGAEEGADDPSVQRAIAMAYDRIGDILGGVRGSSLGRPDDAIAHYRIAREIRAPLLAESADDPELLRDAANNHIRMGDVLFQLENNAEGAQEYEDAERMLERLLAIDPAELDSRRLLAVSLLNAGTALARDNQYENALGYYQRSLTIREDLAERRPDDPVHRRDVAVVLGRIGSAYAATGREREAIEQHERALRIKQRLAAEDPENQWAQRDIGISHYAIALVHRTLDEPGEAAAHMNEFRSIVLQLVTANPDDARVQRDLLQFAHPGWVASALAAGDRDGVRRSAEELIVVGQGILVDDPENPVRQRTLALMHEAAGATYESLEDRAAARTAYEAAITLLRPLAEGRSPDPESADDRDRILARLRALDEPG